MPFNIKVANHFSLYKTLPKGGEVAHCVKIPLLWVGPKSLVNSPDTPNIVQFYKASQPKEKILERQYDTQQQDAIL